MQRNGKERRYVLANQRKNKTLPVLNQKHPAKPVRAETARTGRKLETDLG
jgi:hypothetical protein